MVLYAGHSGTHRDSPERPVVVLRCPCRCISSEENDGGSLSATVIMKFLNGIDYGYGQGPHPHYWYSFDY
jgi:hypothetical protein